MKTLSAIWKAAPGAMLMTALAVFAEAVSNGLRAYGIGEHLSHFTAVTPWGFRISVAGIVLVAGAAAVSVYQAKFATIALTSRVLPQRILAGIFLVVCLAISSASMVSHVLEAQRAKGSGEGSTRKTFDRTEAEYFRLLGELNSLAGVRQVDVINADILALKVPLWIWKRSAACTDISQEETRQACEPALKLYKERGNAARKAELERDVRNARVKLDGTERPAELPWLDQWLAFLWPWAFGTGVVLVATFGYAVATMQARPAPAMKPANDPGPGTGSRDEVSQWVREFRSRNHRNPRIPELQRQFQLPKTTAWRRIKAA